VQMPPEMNAVIDKILFPPAEPTSSESSGDVHLANALAEIERLKHVIAEQARTVGKALIIAGTLGLGADATAEQVLKSVNAALARAETAEAQFQQYAGWSMWKPGLWRISFPESGPSAEFVCSESDFQEALATPSPAPVAGKTNPSEISSAGVDAPVAVGEKDSAGPTPITQPLSACDGTHGGERCGAIECWHDSAPVAGEGGEG
jgi:hypothetical protein